jgi:hypothetical protein
MAEKTSDDLLARLALVPRTLEARGLDAAPPIRDKLQAASATSAARRSWKSSSPTRSAMSPSATAGTGGSATTRRLEPVACYAELARRYRAPRLRGPFNLEARRAAGFDERELAACRRHEAFGGEPQQQSAAVVADDFRTALFRAWRCC